MTVPTEEPPQVSGPTYGSMDVSSIRIHSEPTLATHGTTKQYVDGKVSDVKSDILGNAGPSWDTLKEIQVFLEGEPNVSAGLVNQLGSVQSQLDAEVQRAIGVEGALISEIHAERDTRIMAVADVSSRLDSEVSARTANFLAQADVNTYHSNRVDTLSSQHIYTNGRIDDEYARATAAESALSHNLAASVVEINSRTDMALATKFDKSGGEMSGDLRVTGELSIGNNWKLVSLGSSLEFRYSADGEEWKTAIPFFSV